MVNKMSTWPYDELLDFWFANVDRWFTADTKFDALVTKKFQDLYKFALEGQFDKWKKDALGTLALIIVFDQLPRNMYRGTSSMYLSDALALTTAVEGVAAGVDTELPTASHKHLFYMPFMHSEDIVQQDEGVRLFTNLGLEKPLRYSNYHRSLIARFGRFPHRNAILGRESTASEEDFLQLLEDTY